jgi:hypothetical protein
MDTQELHKQLTVVGCDINGCGGDGAVSWIGTPNESLAALVFATIDKSLSSSECLALQAAITNEQWLAYIECRKAPTRQQRQSRYTQETDPLKMKADAEYEAGSEEYKKALEGWRAARLKIQEELPYPE